MKVAGRPAAPQRPRFHVGASRIRAVMIALEPEHRVTFIRSIWPEIGEDLAALIAAYPEETSVNGSYLIIPRSWQRP